MITRMSSAIATYLVFATCAAGLSDEPPVEMETVLIKGATFTLGTPITQKRHPEYHVNEKPLKMTVKDFRIGKYPVTAEQMCAFLNSPEARRYKQDELYHHKDMIAVGSGEVLKYSTVTFSDGKFLPRPGAAQAPANLVTWKGSVLFCKWLSENTGKQFRLPTEAEWELAARGAEGREWPWGKEKPTTQHGERYSQVTHRKTWSTTPVGSHPANATPEGVHDFLAYVIGEWCTNKYVEHPTPAQADDRDIDLNDLATHRIVRGYYHRGRNQKRTNFISWFFLPEAGYHLGRPWTRVSCAPIEATKQAARHGFRVVEEIENSNAP